MDFPDVHHQIFNCGCPHSTFVAYVFVFPQFNMPESAFCAIITRVGCIISAWFVGLVIFLNVFLQFILAFAGNVARVAYVLVVSILQVLQQLISVHCLIRTISTQKWRILFVTVMAWHVFFYLTFCFSSDSTYWAFKLSSFWFGAPLVWVGSSSTVG